MEDLLKDLIEYAIDKKASDIHFVLHNQRLQIQLRTQNEMIDVYQDIWKPSFFEYLKIYFSDGSNQSLYAAKWTV